MDHIDGLFAIATECAKHNRSFAIATIVGTQGRTPRKDGRMIVLPDGTTCGLKHYRLALENGKKVKYKFNYSAAEKAIERLSK